MGGADDGGLDPGRVREAVLGAGRVKELLRHVEVLASVPSTSGLALDDAREGLLVVAGEQTEGRGRHGSRWLSPRGGLYLSFAPPHDRVPDRPTDLSLLAGLAVADAVEKVLRGLDASVTRAGLKWPNDVLLAGGKVAGVLVQSRPAPGGGRGLGSRVVVGIGVNVNTDPGLPDAGDHPSWDRPLPARSLASVAGGPVDLMHLLVDIVQGLLGRIRHGLDAGTLDEYRSRCVTLGTRVVLEEGGARIEGLALDINEDGGLVVEVGSDTTHVVSSGQVHHLRGGP